MNKKFWIDQLGMSASALSILYCIAFPFLLVFGKDILLWRAENEVIKFILIGLSLLIGSASLVDFINDQPGISLARMARSNAFRLRRKYFNLGPL